MLLLCNKASVFVGCTWMLMVYSCQCKINIPVLSIMNNPNYQNFKGLKY